VVKKLTTDDGLSVFWGLAQTKSWQQIERFPCHKKQEGKDGDKLHITRQTRVAAVQFESNLIFKLISIKLSGGYEMVGDISTTSDAMGGGEVKYGLAKTMAIVLPTMWFVAIQERADSKS
jgi:hypothetical protein